MPLLILNRQIRPHFELLRQVAAARDGRLFYRETVPTYGALSHVGEYRLASALQHSASLPAKHHIYQQMSDQNSLLPYLLACQASDKLTYQPSRLQKQRRHTSHLAAELHLKSDYYLLAQH